MKIYSSIFVFIIMIYVSFETFGDGDRKRKISLSVLSNTIHKLYISKKTTELKSLLDALIDDDRDDDRNGEQSSLRNYYVGLIKYRLGLIEYKNGKTWFGDCIKINNHITSQNSQFIEAFTLQAACSNALINYLPEETMSLSAQSTNALQAANNLDSTNPRLLLIKGTSAVYIPPQFGGGIDRAKTLIINAVEQFNNMSNSDANPELPTWGLDEAYMWLGVLNSVTGKKEEALKAINQSLSISDNPWVRDTLLATLQKGEPIGPIFGLQ